MTSFRSTHAICWDTEKKTILDPDIKNPHVFNYTDFNSTSQNAKSILDSLHTSFDFPCILYYAYWKKRSQNKRKTYFSDISYNRNIKKHSNVNV